MIYLIKPNIGLWISLKMN